LPATAIGASVSLFDTLGVELRAGRGLRATDALADAEPVAIINQRLADRLWPDGSAIGRRIRDISFETWFTVVGVAPDLYYEVPGEERDQSRYQVHVPYHHAPRRDLAMLVRTRARIAPDQVEATLGAALRDALHGLDPTLPASQVLSLETIRNENLWGDRLLGQTLSAFAFVAVVLAALGLYGLMAFAIVDRRREFGIRFALGADAGTILRQILGEGMVLAVAGMVLGAVVAAGLSGWMRNTLYGVADGGWLALGRGSLALLAAVLFACWLPARRAARLDPVTALRQE
jgi:hypothetical protein